MRILLNLASRPYSDLGPSVRRLRYAIAALALLSVALGFGLRTLHREATLARDRQHGLDLELARIDSERAGYRRMMAEPVNAQLLAQCAALNQLFEEKAFSWTLAMEALETVLPAGVQVTSIEPVRDKYGHIELHLRVAGPRDRADELVQNLEHSRRFFQPRIVGENSEASSSGANQRLEPVSASNRFDFDVVAEYNPPTAEEEKLAVAEFEAQAKKNTAAAAQTGVAGPQARRSSPIASKQPQLPKPAAATPGPQLPAASPASPQARARPRMGAGISRPPAAQAPSQPPASSAAQGGAK